MANRDLRFDVSALDHASRVFQRMGQAVERFEKRLDRLDGTSVDVDIDVDTEKATRKVSRFAGDVRNQLRAAFSALPTLEIDADSSDVDRDLEQIRRQLADLHNQKIGVDLSAEEAIAETRRLQGELERLGREHPSIEVRASIADAQAKLATVTAEADRLDGRDVELDVRADTDAAVRGLGEIVGLGDAIALAFPLAAAAVAAVPALLATAVVPIAAVAAGIDGISNSTSQLTPQVNQLRGAVSATFEQSLQPAIENTSALFPVLTSGLQGSAVALSSVATEVTGVVSSSAGLQQMQGIFTGVNQIVTSLAPSMALLASNTMELAAMGVAGLRPLGEVMTEVGERWRVVIEQLRTTGQGQAAISALIQVFGALLDLLPPLVSAGTQLMAVIGPPLAGAIRGVANVLQFLTGPLGGATTAVLTFAAAWRTVAIATALGQSAAARLGTAFATLGGRTTAATSNLTRVGQAAAQAGTAAGGAEQRTSRFSGAMGKLGGTLPLIGVALAGIGIAYDELRDRADESATAVVTGSLSIRQAIDQEAAAIGRSSAFWDVNAKTLQETQVEARQKVTAAIREQIAQMDPLSAAQARVTVAQSEMTDAINRYGEGSVQANAATATYQQAVIDLQAAQSQAAVTAANLGLAVKSAGASFGTAAGDQAALQSSTVQLADAFRTLADPLVSATDKAKAFTSAFEFASDAPTQLAESTREVNDALRALREDAGGATDKLINLDGTFNSTSEAGSNLQQKVLAATSAIQDTYGATIAAEQGQKGLAGATADASAKFEQQKESLVGTLMQMGVGEQKARALVDTYLQVPDSIKTTFDTPGAVEATAAAFGLKDSITAVPNDKTVIVKSLTEQAQRQLRDLGLTVTQLPDGSFVITADPSPANTTWDGIRRQIEGRELLAKLGIDPSKFLGAIPGLQADVENSPGAMPIVPGSNGMPDAILGNQGLAQSSPAPQPIAPGANTVPPALAGNQGLAGGALAGQPIAPSTNGMPDAILGNQGLAAASPGVQPIDGNPALFQGQVLNGVAFANGQTGTITVDGNPTMANGKTTSAVRFADGSTGTITVDGRPDPATGKIRGVVTYGNGQHTTITIDPRDLATPAINRIPRSGTTVWTIQYVSVGAAPGRMSGSAQARAAGGYATPRADGAYTQAAARPAAYASGGWRPMSAARAEIVPANQPRIIGDRMRGDEAFIPIDPTNARAQAILARTNQAMGVMTVPARPSVGASTPNLPGMRAQVQAAQVARATGPTTVTVGGAAELRALLSETRAQNAQLVGIHAELLTSGSSPAVVERLDRLIGAVTAGPSATARAAAGRATGALGAW